MGHQSHQPLKRHVVGIVATEAGNIRQAGHCSNVEKEKKLLVAQRKAKPRGIVKSLEEVRNSDKPAAHIAYQRSRQSDVKCINTGKPR